MTTMPTARPAAQTPAKPAPAPAGAGAVPAIDPIKLLKRYKWLLAATAGVGMVMGVVAHYSMLFTYPIYRAEAVYQVFAQEEKVGAPVATSAFKEELEKFMATQVQFFTSEKIIDRAVNDPTLPTEAPRWSERFIKGGMIDSVRASKSLKRGLSAGIIGDSNLIRLSFWANNPKDATAIVKIVGQAYSRDRDNVAGADISERRTLLQRAISDASDAITKLQKDRQFLLNEQNVDTIDQAANGELRNIETLQDTLIDTRRDKESLIVQRDQFRRELEQGPVVTYPESIRKRVEDDPVIYNMKTERNQIESALIAMGKRFDSSHRDVRRLRDMLEAKEQSLQSEREKLLLQLFKAQLDVYTTSVSALEATEADILKKLEVSKARAAELTQILVKVKDIDNEIKGQTESKSKYGNDLKDLNILTTADKNMARVRLYQPASEPKTVTFPRIYIMVPACVLLALGLVGGAVVLFEIVDQRVKSPADIAMIPRTRVLGLIPHAAEDPAAPQRVETVFRDHPGGVLAESLRQLRGTILKRMVQGGHKSLVVLSGMPGSGATSIVVNLAYAAAATEQRVLIIDANFRRPGIHRILGLSEGPGLGDIIAGSATLASATQSTDNPNIKIVSAGSPASRVFERLGTPALHQLLQQAGESFDLILLDVAPSMVAGDGLAIANRCDASMLVVRAFGEKRGMVARLRNDLSESRAEFLGVLVNAVRASAGGYFKSNILATHSYQSGSAKE